MAKVPTRLWLALALVAAPPLAACGDDSCQAVRSTAANAPVIEAFDVLGQLGPEAFPVESSDPWLVVFDARFRDADGNLGAGKAKFYMGSDSSPALVQPLDAVFAQSGVPLDAQGGDIWVSLRFSETTPDNTRARVGLQLVDADGLGSNCYSLDLKFDVK